MYARQQQGDEAPVNDDRAPDRSLVAALVGAHDRSLASEQITELRTSATTSHIFRVGEALVARFPRDGGDPPSARAELLAAGEAMAQFAAASPLPSPRMVGLGEPARGYPAPWSLQTWVSGEVMTPTSHASSGPAALQLADLIAHLRAVDTGGRTFSGSGRGGVLGDHDAWVDHCLRQSEGMLPVERLGEVWTELRATPRTEADVMSHTDLIPANLLTRGDSVVGVLDTGGFGPADPALDLVCAWHLFDAAPRAELRAALAVRDAQWRRGAAWALQQALGLVWYYDGTNPAMAELGRSTIARILDDLELGR